jgi:hypothetical protein
MLLNSFLTIMIQSTYSYYNSLMINPLNSELNLICHLMALLGSHRILHISRIRVKVILVSYLYLGHTSGWFPSGFVAKILCALLFFVHSLSLTSIVCTHNIILELSNIFYIVLCDLFAHTLFCKMFVKISIYVFYDNKIYRLYQTYSCQ